jgi:hypothetical protein
VPGGGSMVVPLVVRVGAGETGPQTRRVHVRTDNLQQPSIDVRLKYQVAAEETQAPARGGS